MRYASVCSGVEAASLAWEPLGFEPVFFSEVEKFPCEVLAHRWPDVPNLGDMTKIDGKSWRGQVDVLVGGTPCQAFSVAGLRKGLDDERGNLSVVFAGLARDISPEYVVWENVPGVLSDKTNAFGCLLGALAGEDDPLQPPGDKWTNAGFVLGPERAIAWRIIDAQYTGVAQRRRRCFVVACPRDGADPRAILFEREGVRRDTAPSREAGQGVAGATGGSVESGCRGNSRVESEAVVGALSCNTGPNGHDAGNFACNQAVDAGHVIPVRVESKAVIYQDSEFGCQAYETAGSMRAGRIPEHQVVLEPIPLKEPCKCLSAAGSVKNALHGEPGDPSFTLNANWPQGVAVAFPQNQCGDVLVTPHCPSIGTNSNATGRNTPKVCYGLQTDATPKFSEDISFTLKLPSKSGGGQPAAVAFTTRGRADGLSVEYQEDLAYALKNPGNGGRSNDRMIAHAMQVRRLTPTECERLQGMPDGHTQIQWRGKPAEDCPDGPRYKAIGNSMAVPCMRWIGERIIGGKS